MGATLLQLEQIDLAVGPDGARRLMSGLSLTLVEREMVGVYGPSGCGKTTLLRAIAGLIDAAGGRVTHEGRLPAQVGWPRFRRRVIYVAQRPTLLEGSVRDNLRRPFTYASVEHGYEQARADALLEGLGLDAGVWDQAARSLSEGQQQRVCLIRALLLRPSVLLLDEPTSALDAEARDAMERTVRAYVDEAGAAALVVTHDTAAAVRWCDRAVDLRPWLTDRAAGVNHG